MAKEYKNDKFKIIELDRESLEYLWDDFNWGWSCARCDKPVILDGGYYLAVLHEIFCKSCIDNIIEKSRISLTEEEIRKEARNFEELKIKLGIFYED